MTGSPPARERPVGRKRPIRYDASDLMGPDGSIAHDQLAAAIEHAPTALAVVDRDGRFLLANRALARLASTDAPFPPETPLHQVVDPADLAGCQRALQTAIEQGRCDPIEIRLRATNPIVWCRVDFAALAGAMSAVATFENVTEHRRVVDDLRESNERYRLAVDHANDIIFNVSLMGHFTFVNPTACLLTKYLERELIGMHFRRLIREDARADAERLYGNQVAQRIPSTYHEFPIVTRDDEEIWLGQYVQLILDGDRIVGIQALARDITQRRLAEEALRRSEERLRAVVSSAPIVLWATDQNGRLILCEGQVLSKLDFVSAELIGKPVGAVIEDPLLDAHLDRARAGEAFQVELTIQDQLFDSWFSPALDERGIVTGVIGVAVDVTDRQLLQERLYRAEKLEAVGQLAGGVAHDLNNQLTSILGFAELLKESLSDDDERRSNLVEIAKAGRRAANVTEQLLAYGRKQPRLPKVVSVNDVVMTLLPLLRRSVGEDITIETQLSDALEPVHADPTQLERCLLNLAMNARDAIVGTGVITISTEMVDITDPTATQTPIMSRGQYATIAVADTGRGMDDATRRRVFEPFFTTKEVGKGTGLGLASVYGIVKQSGGHMWLTSSLGHGAAFRMLLPKAVGVGSDATTPTIRHVDHSSATRQHS